VPVEAIKTRRDNLPAETARWANVDVIWITFFIIGLLSLFLQVMCISLSFHANAYEVFTWWLVK
jgi:hypothetical protein